MNAYLDKYASSPPVGLSACLIPLSVHAMHKPSLIRPVPDLTTYLTLALVSAIWGGTFVAGRAMSGELPPMFMASVRFILATAALASILAISKAGFVKIGWSQAIRIAGLGFSGIYAYNIFFFYGLDHTSASRASLIVAINPAVMAIFSCLFLKERVSIVQTLGIALCLLGAAFVIIGKSPDGLLVGPGHWTGDALILGCVLSWVVYSVFCRSIVREIGALHTVAYSVFAGTAMLTITAIATGQMNSAGWDALSIRNILCLLYLGVIGSALAYVLYYDSIRRIGATRAGSFIALNPLTAVLAGAMLLGEQLTALMLVGGSLVIGGILLVNRRPATTPASPAAMTANNDDAGAKATAK